MGFLSNILENPALIGMAMAGMSRDPEAPMNAMRSYGMMDEIQRRRQLEAKQEAERLANAKLLSAIQQQRGTDQNMLSEAIESFGQYRNTPRTIQGFTPDQQSGTAVDYETGQAYTPQQVANPNRMAARQAVYQKLAQMHRRPPMDFSQFAEADPKVILSAMSHMDASSPAQKFMDMMDKNKPISMKEGETLVDPDTYEPVANVPRKQTLEQLKMDIINDPSKLDTLPPAIQRMLGAASPEKSVNMPPAYDMVGMKHMGAKYHSSAGQQAFSQMYATDPKIQQEVTALLAEEARAKYQAPLPIITYLQTSEGFVPMPVRGGGAGNVPMGQPIPGVGKPVPSEQLTAGQQGDTLRETVDRVKTLYKDEYVGPVAGRYSQVKENYVGLPSEQGRFYADLANAQNALVYLYSGKQINEQEFKRLKAALPDRNLPPDTFKARLQTFETLMNSIMTNRSNQLQQGGYGPQPGARPQSAPAQQQTTTPKVIRYDSKGQRIQ